MMVRVTNQSIIPIASQVDFLELSDFVKDLQI